MPLKRHLETIERHVAQGNNASAERVAETLLRQYARQADKNKILAAIGK